MDCKKILETIRSWKSPGCKDRKREIERGDLWVSNIAQDLENALKIMNVLVDRNPELLRDHQLSMEYSPGSEAWKRGDRIYLVERLLQSQALENYLELEERKRAQAFEAAIMAPDFSHVSTRERFGGMAYAYRSDKSSPSGVLNSGAIDMKNRYYNEILAEHKVNAATGPTRGDIAARKWST